MPLLADEQCQNCGRHSEASHRNRSKCHLCAPTLRRFAGYKLTLYCQGSRFSRELSRVHWILGSVIGIPKQFAHIAELVGKRNDYPGAEHGTSVPVGCISNQRGPPFNNLGEGLRVIYVPPLKRMKEEEEKENHQSRTILKPDNAANQLSQFFIGWRLHNHHFAMCHQLDLSGRSTQRKSDHVPGVTLPGLLNGLDGVTAPEGGVTRSRIFFATTNNIASLDPALLGDLDVSDTI
ncbi:hypothetical protein B0H14DRAFT_3128384 [Mycena olivaceomarginata]|nr:hypothetical protein B0H14DRAFT_3128384 [Mycena olivaceomarginata]